MSPHPPSRPTPTARAALLAAMLTLAACGGGGGSGAGGALVGAPAPGGVGAGGAGGSGGTGGSTGGGTGGGSGGTGSGSEATPPPAATGVRATPVAGAAYADTVQGSFADGAGAAARFFRIDRFVVDPAGNIYASDAGNCAIRKIAPDGLVSTLAGSGGRCGFADGRGAEARFQSLRGMARDAAGNLYVGDGAAVRKITPDGVVSTLAGNGEASDRVDGSGAAARFWKVQGLDLAPDGSLLVSDGPFNAANRDYLVCGPISNALRTVTLQGAVTTVPGTTLLDCAGTPAPLTLAADLRYGAGGTLYLFHGTLLARQRPGAAAELVTDAAGKPLSETSYNGNRDMRVAPDDAGNLYYMANNTVYKVAPDGARTIVLSEAADAPAQSRPDLPVGTMAGLTWIGNHTFLASFDNRVVRVTLP